MLGMSTPATTITPQPVSLRNVAPWIVKARGFPSTLAHDIAQERALRWIQSAPFGER